MAKTGGAGAKSRVDEYLGKEGLSKADVPVAIYQHLEGLSQLELNALSRFRDVLKRSRVDANKKSRMV